MRTHTHHAPTASIGLILSIASELPHGNRLARKARALANRLGRDPDRRLQDRAAALLSALLTATDPGLTFGQDGLIDDRFDD